MLNVTTTRINTNESNIIATDYLRRVWTYEEDVTFEARNRWIELEYGVFNNRVYAEVKQGNQNFTWAGVRDADWVKKFLLDYEEDLELAGEHKLVIQAHLRQLKAFFRQITNI
ncbi:hypothetical protein NRE35_004218 [Salmonella enterica]|nr:hypothetical protein [Salmonella enterica subsp. enterica serovar Oslo]EEX4841312.1 hypothetical protein [Escherichia coli]EJO2543852.1 hypothetical protein [Salmonella enterica]ELF5188718.1 hypothetical protein [Salmonella enterica]